eukprot:scaffold2835_cov259-Pinguiococcus_pyrenoidosus.AAC.9
MTTRGKVELESYRMAALGGAGRAKSGSNPGERSSAHSFLFSSFERSETLSAAVEGDRSEKASGGVLFLSLRREDQRQKADRDQSASEKSMCTSRSPTLSWAGCRLKKPRRRSQNAHAFSRRGLSEAIAEVSSTPSNAALTGLQDKESTVTRFNIGSRSSVDL